MSHTRSTFRVFGLVLLAIFFGGLLFAQVESTEETAPKASPSDKKSAGDDAQAKETPKAESEPEGQAATQPKAESDDAPEPASAPSGAIPPDKIDRQSEADVKANWQRLIASLTVFVLAVFVGFEVITKVPPTLHTPLMSGSNAISGITLVGAVIVAASLSFSGFVGFLAVALATVNAVGGFMVTHRMLAMFKKR